MEYLVKNGKAGFDFELGDKYEAGIELVGSEVKSIKNHKGKLEGAFVDVRGGEAFLMGADIPEYQPNNVSSKFDSLRVRKILLTKKEIETLSKIKNEKGLTLVPTAFFLKNNKIKLAFAIGKGKKKFDKRASIKKRDVEREVGRRLKA